MALGSRTQAKVGSCLSFHRVGFGWGVVMFIHSHSLNLLADTQRFKQLQDQENEAREEARPQNYHEDHDELRSNGCASDTALAACIGLGNRHASPATPAMVVILLTTTSGLTNIVRHTV